MGARGQQERDHTPALTEISLALLPPPCSESETLLVDNSLTRITPAKHTADRPVADLVATSNYTITPLNDSHERDQLLLFGATHFGDSGCLVGLLVGSSVWGELNLVVGCKKREGRRGRRKRCISDHHDQQHHLEQ